MSTKRIIEQILTFGLGGRMGHHDLCGYVRVAAGDPSKVVMDINPAVQLSENFSINGRQLKLSDYVVFEVIGKSMEPQGIANGDFLLAKEIGKLDSIHLNDYIIIEVDTTRIDNPECDYKLRRALATINPSDDVDLVMESLKKQGHHQLLLDKYQQMFQEKYNKARSQYKEDILVASITYRDGEMKYSFHSRRFVKFRAEIKARIDMADTGWSAL
jgi:hypothetical protein